MNMKLSIIALAIAGLTGCANNQAPDVTGNIRNSLKQAGLNDVSVSQNRDKGVVTLGGTVQRDAQKAQAEQIANSQAAGQVVADEISVLPSSDSNAKTVNSDLDKGIENNLDAAYTQANMKGVRHSTTNGVVTLKGEVNTPALRQDAERLASGVPYVRQVVNELDVKNQRATSTGRQSSADRSKQ